MPAMTRPPKAATSALPPGPFRRVLWLSTARVPEGWAALWRSRDDGQELFDAIVLDDLVPDKGARASETTVEALQRRLAPGGLLAVLAPRRPRAVAAILRPYFEGGAPRGRERYRSVQAVHGSVLAYRRGPTMALGHFDELAQDYAAEIPAHLMQHYLDRKLAILRRALDGRPARLGLDLGCGVGEYARAVAASMDAHVVAVDASQPAVAVARQRGLASTPKPTGHGLHGSHGAGEFRASAGFVASPSEAASIGGVEFAAADAQRLPFSDATFDFAYTINMVHHLKRGEQRAAMTEALRVLKPGAPLVVFEINILNPLFRFYMRHVFPRTRCIDRGDEEFLTPGALRRMAPAPVERVAFSTFVPDFTPRWLLPALRPLERGLERVAGPMGIHYAAVLRRGGPGEAGEGADKDPVA